MLEKVEPRLKLKPSNVFKLLRTRVKKEVANATSFFYVLSLCFTLASVKRCCDPNHQHLSAIGGGVALNRLIDQDQ